MTKNIAIAVLFLLVIASSTWNIFQARRISDSDERSIRARVEKERAQDERKSALEALKLTRDTLELAYQVATNAKRDAAIAHFETQKVKKQYESIIFKRFSTDSLRLAELKRLYPGH